MRPGIDRYASESAPRNSRTSSTVRPAATSCLVEPMSTPMKQGKRMGGLETRMCTSRAPARRITSMMRRDVVPRTIESSTATTRLPRSDRRSGFSFSITPASRRDWSGWMNVRLMYLDLISPSRNGMPDSSAYPMAAVVPDDHLPRLDLADEGGVDCVERTGLRGHHVGGLTAERDEADAQRPEAIRVTQRDHGVLGDHGAGVG